MASGNIRKDDFDECVEVLFKENEKKNFLEAAVILVKIATNIYENPHVPKYRSLRLGNPAVDKKLLTVSGALECLFAMGFQENGDRVTMPANLALHSLVRICNQIKLKIAHLRATIENKTFALKSYEPPKRTAKPSEQRVEATTPNVQRTVSEREIYRQLRSNMLHVRMYEDRHLLEKARAVVPQNNLNGSDADVTLLNLLAWFKHEFFTWTDKPACSFCSNPNTIASGTNQPNADEVRWMARVIELYKCNECGTFTRFPRYNHPEKLLQTRTGRCGEYANCFTLVCRAAGYEARFILDLTDHVWTEVYSTVQNRWLHCDPCENICDLPLTYEVGWKKSLAYVFAFSVNDVMDVTWRYTKDHTKTLTRRSQCRESWLRNTILELNNEIQSNLSASEVEKIKIRYVRELVEFMTPASDADDSRLTGRVSGSLQWRRMRGETEAPPASENQQYIFTLTDLEKQTKLFHLRYNTSRDCYIRVSDYDEVLNGFNSCLTWQKSMLRKVENDWGMVYLARKPSEHHGTLCWSFNFGASGLCFRSITVRVNGTTFETGKVDVKILIDARVIPIATDGVTKLVENIEFENKFMLSAELTGGVGDCAWQHAQLFRQKLRAEDEFPFEIIIDFMRDSGSDSYNSYSISE